MTSIVFTVRKPGEGNWTIGFSDNPAHPVEDMAREALTEVALDWEIVSVERAEDMWELQDPKQYTLIGGFYAFKRREVTND